MADTEQTNRIERRKTEFRDKITRAALKLFGQQGIAETSVISIIKEADIAHKTFFNHFPTKDHLLHHIASTFSDEAYSVIGNTLQKYNDPRKMMEYCLLSVAEALEAVDPNYKELLNFYLISGTGATELRSVQKKEFSAVIDQIMKEAKKQKILRPGFTLDALTEIVVGICVSTLLNWSIEDDYPIVPKMKTAIKFINSTIFIDE